VQDRKIQHALENRLLHSSFPRYFSLREIPEDLNFTAIGRPDRMTAGVLAVYRIVKLPVNSRPRFREGRGLCAETMGNGATCRIFSSGAVLIVKILCANLCTRHRPGTPVRAAAPAAPKKQARTERAC
jgi:hypothetical protein